MGSGERRRRALLYNTGNSPTRYVRARNGRRTVCCYVSCCSFIDWSEIFVSAALPFYQYAVPSSLCDFFFNFRLPFLKAMLIFTSRTEERQVQQSAPGGYETILGFCCALSSPYGHYKNFSGSESESESIFCFPQSGVGNRWKKLCVHSLTCSLSYNWQKRAQKHIEK